MKTLLFGWLFIFTVWSSAQAQSSYPVRPENPSYPPYPVRPDDPSYPPYPVYPPYPYPIPYPTPPVAPYPGNWRLLTWQFLSSNRWIQLQTRRSLFRGECLSALRIRLEPFMDPRALVYVKRAFIEEINRPNRPGQIYPILGLQGVYLRTGEFVFALLPYGDCLPVREFKLVLDLYSYHSSKIEIEGYIGDRF